MGPVRTGSFNVDVARGWKKFDMNESKKWVIAFIDDSSWFNTCCGVFDSPTTENAIAVLT
jgi:hypothetical protein